jgi:hypothetical protein
VFRDRHLAENAVSNLKAAGFRATDVAFVSAELHDTDAGLGWLCEVKQITLNNSRPLVIAGPISLVYSNFRSKAQGHLRDLLAACGMPASDSDRVAARVLAGRTLIVLYCDNEYWTRRGIELLENNGATEVAGVGPPEPEKSRQAGERAMAGGGRHWD